MKYIAYKEMFENELTHPWYVMTRRLMIYYLKKNFDERAKILDAGCGTGGTMKFLQRSGFKNVFGVDISPLAISLCKKRGFKNVQNSSINKLPFKTNSFEAIISLDVLYHKGVDYYIAIKEFKRLLVPGGTLYLQEPAYNWIRGTHDYVIEADHRFTSTEIKNLVETNGFKISKISHFNSTFLLPIIIKRLTDKILSDKKNTKSDVHKMNRVLNLIFKTTLSVEYELIKFFNLPFGLSIICCCKR